MAKKKVSRPRKPKAAKEGPKAAAPATAEASPSAEPAKPTPRKAAKRKSRPRRGAAKRQKPKAKAAARKKASKPTKGRKRYTPAEKAKILAAARNEKLTGAQVAKRFGVSPLSYYTWRKKAGAAARRGPKAGSRTRGRRVGARVQGSANLSEMVRRAVQAQIARVLPQILQSEVDTALSSLLGRPKTRRRR